MSKSIEIIERGRGPQLSTSRITVMDLVPYFQTSTSVDEIIQWMPTLSRAEIQVAHDYYCAHQQDFDERDRKVREYREEQIRKQRLRFPEEDREQRLQRMEQLLRQRQQGANGEGHPG